jgi:dTDP-4-amino-4,6-dideoxygalactose transaminase
MKMRWMGIDKSTYSRSNVGSYSWRYDVDTVGYKYHMNDISAAIGLGQLKVLDNHNNIRKDVTNYYLTHINNPLVTLPVLKTDRISSNHIFHIKIDGRDGLLDDLTKNRILCGVHYYPNHLYNIFKGDYDLPVTDSVYDKLISLPMHTLLTIEDVKFVCKIINDFGG